ncbi:MAG: hypothetical protein EPN22_12020 [Nitrospirae bacterium]|nr:MAG: hypothetical protein EPN22_12020 [Nitrospirota bacterium]
MKTKQKVLEESKIDDEVIAQSERDACWEKPVKVRRSKTIAMALPAALAARASFFARLHRENNTEAWIKRIIQERIDIEEAAFAVSKKELVARHAR